MRGITSWGTCLPHWRLDRTTIAAVAGSGGGRGTRTVAGFDQDAVCLAVEAARAALDVGSSDAEPAEPDTLLFATTAPPVVDHTNATVVHAACGLPATVAAIDLGSSVRSAVGGLVMALRGPGTALVTAGDLRGGRAGSAEEAGGGDAGAAVVVADDDAGAPVVAEVLATASATAEVLDRWRVPGEPHSRTWDERFTEVALRPLVIDAWERALAAAGLTTDDVDLVVVSAPTARAAAALARATGVTRVADDLTAGVGVTGAAHPLLSLANALESLGAGDDATGRVVALVHAGDGADVVVLRTTAALAPHVADLRTGRTVADQLAAGAPVAYGRSLSWRGVLDVEPPRRPEPQRVSSPAAWRAAPWKYAFVGSRDPDTGRVHLPPSRVSADGLRTDTMESAPLASATGTVATFTVDRVAYSPSPPIIFAVVDFDGGGRFPVELCDLAPDEVAIGTRVELTFRRLHAADGIPNYFWKARPVRAGTTTGSDPATDGEDA
jgi:hydroxymethylglutaryl-CoA synthase